MNGGMWQPGRRPGRPSRYRRCTHALLRLPGRPPDSGEKRLEGKIEEGVIYVAAPPSQQQAATVALYINVSHITALTRLTLRYLVEKELVPYCEDCLVPKTNTCLLSVSVWGTVTPFFWPGAGASRTCIASNQCWVWVRASLVAVL